MELADYIIIGSGCTGAIAAETLCSSGKKVVLIDTGIETETENSSNTDFISKRLNDTKQSDYFLGEQFEVLQENKNPNIPQITPQRSYINRLTDDFLPVKTSNFFPVESLALGGLGNSWGLGSYTFSAAEIKKCGLDEQEMNQAYAWVAKKIGISGVQQDDASVFCHNNIIELQNTINLNPAANDLYNRYKKHKEAINKKQLYMGRPSLAILTEDKDHRKAYSYNDTDFYDNPGDSTFRPPILIHQLIQQGKLEYKPGWLVRSFVENEQGVEVKCQHIKTEEQHSFFAKKLIIAASTLSTARIVLRSMNPSAELPVLCNAYTYMPMVYLPYLGKQHTGPLCGLAQLAMFYDINQDQSEIAMASVYNYRSLLNFRILKQMPLNYADGGKFLQLLLPTLFIAGIFHPASYQQGNHIRLTPANTKVGDILETNYTYSGSEQNQITETEKQYARAFFKLNCFVLKKLRTATGGSIHYAGALPFSEREEPFRLAPDGRLYGTKNVYVADGSGFTYLPGKGLTLSLMANAHIVAKNIQSHA
jgi:hypothetical protein